MGVVAVADVPPDFGTRFLLSLLLASLAVSGCASAAYWHKPGATSADVVGDNDACRQESRRTRRVWIPRAGAVTRVTVDYDRYRTCMEAKGYEWVGRWPAPEGSSRGAEPARY